MPTDHEGVGVNELARRSTIAMVTLATLMSGCRTTELQDEDRRTTRAMLDQFETVFRSDARFVFGDAGVGEILKERADSLRAPFALLLGAVEALPEAQVIPSLDRAQHPSRVTNIKPSVSRGGIQTWQWSAPPSEGHPDPYSFYLSQLTSQHLGLCTGPPELEALKSSLDQLSGSVELTRAKMAHWREAGCLTFLSWQLTFAIPLYRLE
jgi:hypothetical protein